MSHFYVATKTHVGSRVPWDTIRQLGKEKIQRKVRIAPSGCWEWMGVLHPKGYAETCHAGRRWRVHRLAYTLWRGEIPPGMVICHTCDNRRCCNPLHLFIGTYDTNNKDMAAKGRCKYSAPVWPVCKNGHQFTPENTRICKRGFRHCKACEKIAAKKPSTVKWRQEYQRRRRALQRAQRLQSSENDEQQA